MKEVMYDQSSLFIAGSLFVGMIVATKIGATLGRRYKDSPNDFARVQTDSVQASLLGILALLLGFTFSLAIGRYDARSQALVDEANAIGTAYLRAELLHAEVRPDTLDLLQRYLDIRIASSQIDLVDEDRPQLLAEANTLITDLWQQAIMAAEVTERPAITALYIKALNDMIDAYAKRDAELNRHVPEIVLMLLYFTFISVSLLLGYATGMRGNKVTFAAYIQIFLIVLLVFLIIDLDRPRRGIIEVSQQSLIDLKATFDVEREHHR